MENDRNIVLTSSEIKQKIRRIVFEIYEHNFSEKTIVLAGIEGQGYLLAGYIKKELESISTIETSLIKVDRTNTGAQFDTSTIDIDKKKLTKKCIIIVDDVLNTGKTLAFAMSSFLSIGTKKIEIAVLVNRSRVLYPIQPSYTGLELATTLNEHVEVVLKKHPAVYLH